MKQEITLPLQRFHVAPEYVPICMSSIYVEFNDIGGNEFNLVERAKLNDCVNSAVSASVGAIQAVNKGEEGYRDKLQLWFGASGDATVEHVLEVLMRMHDILSDSKNKVTFVNTIKGRVLTKEERADPFITFKLLKEPFKRIHGKRGHDSKGRLLTGIVMYINGEVLCDYTEEKELMKLYYENIARIALGEAPLQPDGDGYISTIHDSNRYSCQSLASSNSGKAMQHAACFAFFVTYYFTDLEKHELEILKAHYSYMRKEERRRPPKVKVKHKAEPKYTEEEEEWEILDFDEIEQF